MKGLKAESKVYEVKLTDKDELQILDLKLFYLGYYSGNQGTSWAMDHGLTWSQKHIKDTRISYNFDEDIET